MFLHQGWFRPTLVDKLGAFFKTNLLPVVIGFVIVLCILYSFETIPGNTCLLGFPILLNRLPLFSGIKLQIRHFTTSKTLFVESNLDTDLPALSNVSDHELHKANSSSPEFNEEHSRLCKKYNFNPKDNNISLKTIPSDLSLDNKIIQLTKALSIPNVLQGGMYPNDKGMLLSSKVSVANFYMNPLTKSEGGTFTPVNPDNCHQILEHHLKKLLASKQLVASKSDLSGLNQNPQVTYPSAKPTENMIIVSPLAISIVSYIRSFSNRYISNIKDPVTLITLFIVLNISPAIHYFISKVVVSYITTQSNSLSIIISFLFVRAIYMLVSDIISKLISSFRKFKK